MIAGGQETVREDLRETREKLIQAGVERDRNALRLQQLTASRPATADGSGGMAAGGSEVAELDEPPGVIEQHLTRCAASCISAILKHVIRWCFYLVPNFDDVQLS